MPLHSCMANATPESFAPTGTVGCTVTVYVPDEVVGTQYAMATAPLSPSNAAVLQVLPWLSVTVTPVIVPPKFGPRMMYAISRLPTAGVDANDWLALG